jgi:mannitol-1-/sugar-/sorbitol-6-/2-deoxyglucose-6-phosphatase
MTSPIDAVIFDLDGVVVASEPLWHKAEVEVFRSVGVPLTPAMCLETTGVRVDAVVRHWHARHPWTSPSLKEVEVLVVAAVAALVAAEGAPMPGAIEAVDHVRACGLKVGVASSSPRVIIAAALARLGIANHFGTVQSAEGLLRGKPDPEVYLRTCAALGVVPARAVAVEDSDSGIRAALAAGMICVAVPDPAAHTPAALSKAHAVLSDLRRFPAWLDEQRA